jgi:hypothetical protein
MTTKTRPREYYIDRIKAHLLKKYPGMEFEVDHVDERETFVYCYPRVPMEGTYAVTERAGNIVTDALVDDGYRIYVMTRD